MSGSKSKVLVLKRFMCIEIYMLPDIKNIVGKTGMLALRKSI